MNNGYLFHLLSSRIKDIESMAKINSIKNLSTKDLAEVVIPVPPLPVQFQIADALDRFSELVSEAEKGLPKEIELNEKRYRYWRDKLLSFRRKEA